MCGMLKGTRSDAGHKKARFSAPAFTNPQPQTSPNLSLNGELPTKRQVARVWASIGLTVFGRPFKKVGEANLNWKTAATFT